MMTMSATREFPETSSSLKGGAADFMEKEDDEIKENEDEEKDEEKGVEENAGDEEDRAQSDEASNDDAEEDENDEEDDDSEFEDRSRDKCWYCSTPYFVRTRLRLDTTLHPIQAPIFFGLIASPVLAMIQYMYIWLYENADRLNLSSNYFSLYFITFFVSTLNCSWIFSLMVDFQTLLEKSTMVHFIFADIFKYGLLFYAVDDFIDEETDSTGTIGLLVILTILFVIQEGLALKMISRFGIYTPDKGLKKLNEEVIAWLICHVSMVGFVFNNTIDTRLKAVLYVGTPSLTILCVFTINLVSPALRVLKGSDKVSHKESHRNEFRYSWILNSETAKIKTKGWHTLTVIKNKVMSINAAISDMHAHEDRSMMKYFHQRASEMNFKKVGFLDLYTRSAMFWGYASQRPKYYQGLVRMYLKIFFDGCCRVHGTRRQKSLGFSASDIVEARHEKRHLATFFAMFIESMWPRICLFGFVPLYVYLYYRDWRPLYQIHILGYISFLIPGMVLWIWNLVSAWMFFHINPFSRVFAHPDVGVNLLSQSSRITNEREVAKELHLKTCQIVLRATLAEYDAEDSDGDEDRFCFVGGGMADVWPQDSVRMAARAMVYSMDAVDIVDDKNGHGMEMQDPDAELLDELNREIDTDDPVIEEEEEPVTDDIDTPPPPEKRKESTPLTKEDDPDGHANDEKTQETPIIVEMVQDPAKEKPSLPDGILKHSDSHLSVDTDYSDYSASEEDSADRSDGDGLEETENEESPNLGSASLGVPAKKEKRKRASSSEVVRKRRSRRRKRRKRGKRNKRERSRSNASSKRKKSTTPVARVAFGSMHDEYSTHL